LQLVRLDSVWVAGKREFAVALSLVFTGDALFSVFRPAISLLAIFVAAGFLYTHL
jgi:hypothetical protein